MQYDAFTLGKCSVIGSPAETGSANRPQRECIEGELDRRSVQAAIDRARRTAEQLTRGARIATTEWVEPALALDERDLRRVWPLVALLKKASTAAQQC